MHALRSLTNGLPWPLGCHFAFLVCGAIALGTAAYGAARLTSVYDQPPPPPPPPPPDAVEGCEMEPCGGST